jgi:hypothetical protein
MAQIEVADTIAGATELTGGQVFTNDLYNSGDVDYYKLPGTLFAVPSAMDVNFGLGGQNASSSAFKISVISYDGTTETVLTSKSTAVATTIQASASVAGKAYYLKVEKDQAYSGLDYTISVDVSPTAESELISGGDANNTLSASNPIQGAATYYGSLQSADLASNDGDWYYFTTGATAGASVTLSLSAFTQSTASGSLYNVKITDENGQTVSKVGNKALSTSAGSSAGTLEFEVGATGTPAGTYFVQVTAANSSSFTSTTENGQNYALTLAGTSAFNTTPSLTIADLTSGASGTQKDSATGEFIGFKNGTSTKLSEFISASDAEATTDATQNGLISSYLFRLVGSSTNGVIEYTKDSDSSTATIAAQASASGAFVGLSKAEFATAVYKAASSGETQDIYALVRDSSDVNTISGLTTDSDTSGIIKYALKSSDAGIAISKVSAGTPSALTEGSTDEITLTATLSGTVNSNETVRLIITTEEDLVISGSNVTASSNANEYVVAFTAEGAKTFKIKAPSVADSDGTVEDIALDYRVLSSDSSSLFSGLKLESDKVAVSENIANFSVGSVSYSSGTNVEEGKSTYAEYTITATGIADGQTLTLVSTGSKFEFISDAEVNFTKDSNTATVKVKAKENSDVDGDASTALFDGVLSHKIYENSKLLTAYDLADATVKVKDDDVNFAPVAVDDTITTAIEGVKAITIPGSTLTANDTDANAGATLTVSSASKTSAVKKGTSVDVPGAISTVGGNVIFTPTDTDFLGEVTVVFNYNVSDGTKTDTGAATVNLKFNEGTQVAIGDSGKHSSTSDIEIITGRASAADEFIFVKPDTGNLASDIIKGFEVGTDKLTLTGYSLADYSVTTDASGNSLVTFSDSGSITLEAASSSSNLDFKQISASSSVELYLSGTKVDTLSASSSGVATAKAVSAYDSAKISNISDFSTNLAVSGGSAASNPITLGDVLAQLKHIIGMTPLEGNAAAAADSNNSGAIDLGDVLANLKHIIGMTPIDTFDIVTSHGLITDKMNTDSNGEVSLVINGDADQSHADWDFIA